MGKGPLLPSASERAATCDPKWKCGGYRSKQDEILAQEKAGVPDLASHSVSGIKLLQNIQKKDVNHENRFQDLALLSLLLLPAPDSPNQ